MGSMGEIVIESSKNPALNIPPRPEVINILIEEKDSDEPDLKRVSKAIMADVGLAGAMLKAVNSPAFGLRNRISSIAAAVDLLGMKNVSTMATGLVLRHTGGSGGPAMNRFWDTAEKVAAIAAYLAGRLRGISKDEAYTYGLFHDCGIPMLMQRYPEYKTVLGAANKAQSRGFTAIEDEALGTHHAAMGYFLARSWYLSDDLSQAILLHHEMGIYEAGPSVSNGALNLIGIGHLAEHVHHNTMRASNDVEWEKFEMPVCRHFGLDGEDLINLLEDAQAFASQVEQ